MKQRPVLIPAIDLKGGACVRLRQGDIDSATVFNGDAAAQARAFEAAGFRRLHVVDLDGAFAGSAVNGEAVARIIAAIRMPVQLGGGIRTLAAIEGWLDRGVERVILGTAAVKDPDLVRTAAARFAGRIAVGLDARDGLVAVEGWAARSSLTSLDLARRFEDAGVAALIYTNIARDGMLQGIDWDGTLALAAAVSIPVVASGGLASMQDIDRLAAPDAAHLEGAIAGRALYEGRIDVAEALARLAA